MPDDWWARLRERWWPGDRIHPAGARRRYYQAKRDVVERVQPAFIAEIGVRAGYSAWAMLDAAPEGCRYLGIDKDDGTHGGDTGALDHARQILDPFDAVIWVEDSQAIDRLPGGVDLLHVDGDHSYGGCLADLRLAERSGARWVLVDDFDYLPEVNQATVAFVTGNPAVWSYAVIHDGHRGMAEIGFGEQAGCELAELLS